MTEKHFVPGYRIFKEGDPSDVAYLIVSGQVEILKQAPHGDVQLAVLGPGQVFGEMSLFDGGLRSASARAMEETVVSIISQTEMEQLMQQCPATFRPFLNAIFDRLRATNQKLSAKERASTIIECDYDEIIFEPGSAALKEWMKPETVSVSSLPYRIGGQAKDQPGDDSVNNNLRIPCEGPPLIVSRRHLQIEVREKTVFAVDRGSRFGSDLDGVPFGKGKGTYSLPLNKGEHTLKLGNKHTPYVLKLTCR